MKIGLIDVDSHRNVRRSLYNAISEFKYQTGNYPKRIFAEGDAYQCIACNDSLFRVVYLDDPKFMGITVSKINRPGFEIHLSAGPITLREYPDPQVVFIPDVIAKDDE